MKSKEEVIQQLTEIAQQYENADEAKKILDLIDSIESGRQDPAKIQIKAKMTLNKYDGEMNGQDPVETITSTDEF